MLKLLRFQAVAPVAAAVLFDNNGDAFGREFHLIISNVLPNAEVSTMCSIKTREWGSVATRI